MKKLIILALLAAIVVPVSAKAVGEVVLEDQQSTNSWCAANYPVVALTIAEDGLICDLLLMRDNLRRLLEFLQRLSAARAQLQQLLGRGETPPATGGTPSGEIPSGLTRVKLEARTDKNSYNPGDTIELTVKAKAKENGPSTLNFPSSCQVTYSIAEVGTPRWVPLFNSGVAQDCATATSSVTLPFEWKFTYASTTAPVLAPGNYKVTATVIGYGTAEWHFVIRGARTGAPTITLTDPAANIIWATGTARTIRWQTANASTSDRVDILLTDSSQVHRSLIGTAGTANDGEQNVTLPEALPAGTYNLFLRLTTAANRVVNSNEVQVVINEPGTPAAAPFITGISPTRGATGTVIQIRGNNLTVNQTSNTSPTNLELYFDNKLITNASVPANGQMTFTVPNDTTPGAKGIYLKRGTLMSNTVLFEVLQYPTQPPPTPVETTIEVTAPTVENEEWVKGSTKNITWTSTPASGAATAVNIRIINTATNAVQDVRLGAPNTGTYAWVAGTLANGQIAANGKYRIRVCPVGRGECDRGDKAFKLVASSTASTTAAVSNNQVAAVASLQSLVNQLNQLLRLR